ncbi:hypothetical protein HZA73_09780 [candidate division TA06 bacterium]|nr:hypothetical protein [candidate division TA06 bacterium]
MLINLKALSLVEKIVGAIAIIVSGYYILHGSSAWILLHLTSNIQGFFPKMTFVVETIVNFYLIPLLILVTGLFYVNGKINILAMWISIILCLSIVFMIVVQHGNIKPYLLMLVINGLFLILYIVHKQVESKKKESACCV